MMDENRPALCRNRLKDEGKPHPRSGCNVCRNGGMMGCPHERAEAQDHSAPTRGEVTQGDIDRAADVLAAMADVPTGLEQVEACRQAFAAHRLAAIEEAAKVALCWENFDWNGVDRDTAQAISAQIAQAIRNLGRGV